MKQGKATYVFPGANTCRGYRSFFREGLSGLEQVFILKGGPGCGKSTLIRSLGQTMLEQGHDVEFWQCSADSDSLDGVLIPDLKTAVVDGTPPHVVEPLCPGAVEELVDLGACWDRQELRRQKEEIVRLNRQISGKYADCAGFLAAAGDLLQAGRDNLAAAADSSGDAGLLSHIFGQDQASCRHLFASSVTPKGWVSYLEPLSRRARRRFILTGPFGGGKERLLAAVAAEAEQRRLYAELYHHPLAPEELQLVWLPELSTAVLGVEDAPPRREGDVVIGCGRTADPERAEADRRRLRELTAAGGQRIAEAKALHDRLEDCYRQAMDYAKVEEIKASLLARLVEAERE